MSRTQTSCAVAYCNLLGSAVEAPAVPVACVAPSGTLHLSQIVCLRLSQKFNSSYFVVYTLKGAGVALVRPIAVLLRLPPPLRCHLLRALAVAVVLLVLGLAVEPAGQMRIPSAEKAARPMRNAPRESTVTQM
jgi:hypothetical protein